MVNGYELLINIVTSNGPKTLIGPAQNGNVAGLPFLTWGSTDIHATGGKAEPKPLVRFTRNTVNPYRCPGRLGRSTARKAVGGAGKGWRRKRTPACNGSDRSCVARQHYSTRKRADFRMVSRHEKICSPPKEGKQMTVQQFGTGAPSSCGLHLYA
jgi:hypothetical protein